MLSQQIELEKEMTQASIDKYRKAVIEAKQNGTFSTTKSATAFLKTILDSFTKAIINYLDNYSKGNAVRSTKAAEIISRLNDPENVAFIASKIILDCIYENDPKQAFCCRIGNALSDEFKMMSCKKKNIAYYKAIQKDLNKRNCKRGRRKNIITGVFKKRIKLQLDKWDETDKAQAGQVLLQLFIESTGCIKFVDVYKKGKHYKYLQPTKELDEWLKKTDSFFEVMQPFYLPMVCKPKPWTGIFEGGYISPYLRKNKVIKNSDKNYLEKLNGTDLKKVYTAINILQETPWKINEKILDAVNILWSKGEPVASLPSRDDTPIQKFPFEGCDKQEYTKDEIEKIKQWKLETYLTHKSNVQKRSLRILTTKLLYIANRFKNYAKIYFPHQMDFRGRLYPIPPLLNPQGDDLAKGLLLFAEGKKLNAENVKWLEIHGANVYGIDKVSFQDRIKWVHSHIQEIKECANNPIEYRFWADADKPFQFLAFCMEYVDFLSNPNNFITCLPVRLDGTCNGLQHYSALFRDEVGGRAVNLIDSDKPNDIYATIADRLQEKLKSMADINAYRWLQLGITRKLTKRPVMVLPYGGTLLSCRGYIQEYLTENYSLEFLQNHFKLDKDPENNCFKASNWLAKYLWESIKETVKSAVLGMDYFKALARLVNKAQPFIEWMTPMGLLVRQGYKNRKKTEISTELFGKIIKTTITKQTNDVAKVKQINGICPNFIHSLDAAVLMLYLIKAHKEGIKSFTSVHDCYGTLAPDSELSSKILREAFVEIYKRPILDDFEYDLIGELNLESVPERPEIGILDINEVLKSTYFFN